MTFRALAKTCGCSLETAHKVVTAAEHAIPDVMASNAAPMLTQWRRAASAAARRGDHRPAKEWLLHAGSIDPLPDTKGSGPSITIINAPLPGMPHGPTVTEVRLVSPPAPRDDDR